MLPLLLLLILDSTSLDLEQGIINLQSGFGRKHRPRINGAGHGILPGLEHFVEFLPGDAIHFAVGIHERSIELGA